MNREEILAILGAHHMELRAMGVKTLSLFGSVARGQNSSDSDVDLLVEISRPMGLFDFVRLQQRIEDLLGGVKVDLVLEGTLRQEFRPQVAKELVRAV